MQQMLRAYAICPASNSTGFHLFQLVQQFLFVKGLARFASVTSADVWLCSGPPQVRLHRTVLVSVACVSTDAGVGADKSLYPGAVLHDQLAAVPTH